MILEGGNTIIGGYLTVVGNNNKFVGDIIGAVTRTETVANRFIGLNGWSDTIYQLAALVTKANGRITVVLRLERFT